MAKKPLNIGIVGYGFMGRTHANGYHNAAALFRSPAAAGAQGRLRPRRRES